MVLVAVGKGRRVVAGRCQAASRQFGNRDEGVLFPRMLNPHPPGVTFRSLSQRSDFAGVDQSVGNASRTDRLDRAIGHYREALESLEKLVENGRSTPKSLLALGQAYLNLNQLSDAEAALRDCLSRTPEDVRALRWMGEVAERQGNKEEAIQCYERLLQDFRGPPQARQQIEEKLRKLKG